MVARTRILHRAVLDAGGPTIVEPDLPSLVQGRVVPISICAFDRNSE